MNTTLNNNAYLQDRVGRLIASRLNESADKLPHEVSQRLKAARMQALGKRKVVNTQLVTGVSANGVSAALHLDNEPLSLWSRLGSLIPLLALVAGLFAIGVMQDQNRANEIAEVDAELLTDELPPAAYTDPGFLRFLSSRGQD